MNMAFKCMLLPFKKNFRVKIDPNPGPADPDQFMGQYDPESVSKWPRNGSNWHREPELTSHFLKTIFRLAWPPETGSWFPETGSILTRELLECGPWYLHHNKDLLGNHLYHCWCFNYYTNYKVTRKWILSIHKGSINIWNKINYRPTLVVTPRIKLHQTSSGLSKSTVSTPY